MKLSPGATVSLLIYRNIGYTCKEPLKKNINRSGRGKEINERYIFRLPSSTSKKDKNDVQTSAEEQWK